MSKTPQEMPDHILNHYREYVRDLMVNNKVRTKIVKPIKNVVK